MGDEGPEGPAAVRQRVLLVGRHLGEGAAVALVGDEDRVVAEARRRPRRGRRSSPRPSPRTTTSLPSGQTTAAAATYCARSSGVGDAASSRSTRGIQSASSVQRAEWIAGRAVEGVDLDARVVGDGQPSPVASDDGTGLEQGVGLEGVAGLVHVGVVRLDEPVRRRGCAATSSTLWGLPVARRSVAASADAAVAARRRTDAGPRRARRCRPRPGRADGRARLGRTPRPRRCPAPRRSRRRRSSRRSCRPRPSSPRRRAGRDGRAVDDADARSRRRTSVSGFGASSPACTRRVRASWRAT